MMWKTGTQLWKVFCIVTILAVCMQGFSPVRPAQAATCTVTSANMKTTKPSATFTVTDVAAGGYNYDAAANVETPITVLKP